MTRDRLEELQTKMNNNSQSETIGMQSMPSGSGGGVANSAYMNEFYAEIDEINNRIRTIEKNVESASKLYGKVLATPNNDTTLNNEIEDLTFSIKRSAVDIKDRIKKLEYQVQSERLSPTEFRVKKNQLTNSMDQFKRIMDRYYKFQSEHRDNCKNRIQRQMEIAGKSTTNEDVEKMLESGNAQIFTAEVLSDVKMAKQTLDYIEARHQDIIKIERDILELNEMFLDMSILIQQQGETVDNIENNAFTVIENVETADEKLKSAHENQKSARKKKILVIIIIAAVILIIIGIIAIILAVYIPRPSNNNNSG